MPPPEANALAVVVRNPDGVREPPGRKLSEPLGTDDPLLRAALDSG